MHLKTPATGRILPLAVTLTLTLTMLLPTLMALTSRNCQRLRQSKDHGASLVEWVLILAVLAIAVVTIGAILVTKLTNKANELDLTTP